MARRKKLSTTISPESYNFLETLIKSGRAENFAEALDLALDSLRRASCREQLERATAAYFEKLTEVDVAEENQLGDFLSVSPGELDFAE